MWQQKNEDSKEGEAQSQIPEVQVALKKADSNGEKAGISSSQSYLTAFHDPYG